MADRSEVEVLRRKGVRLLVEIRLLKKETLVFKLAAAAAAAAAAEAAVGGNERLRLLRCEGCTQERG